MCLLPTTSIHTRAGIRILRFAPASRWLTSALLTLLLLTVASVAHRATAETPGPSQYDVESVYLFDFAKFVRWPAGAEHETFTICVAGQKVYVDKLTRIVRGERIASHALSTRFIQRPEDTAGCDILFIDATAKEHLDSLLETTVGKPVLTVSDIPDFFGHGGMIQFLIIDKRIRFAIDLQPVVRSGISLSSELLKVAVTVNGQPAGGGTP